jgi:hypothetical protein
MSQADDDQYEIPFNESDDRPMVKTLFENLRREVFELETLLDECSGDWGYDDPVYRFYHHSFKVYSLQNRTLTIAAKLASLLPDVPLNEWFMTIVQDGTGKEFSREHNQNWLANTRPIVEAFFHARYFLEMAVKFGRSLKFPPRFLPSGWAALLYLYNLR